MSDQPSAGHVQAGGELLALPAPEPGAPPVSLNVSTGEPVKLDHLGPVIVTVTGGLERISNWDQLSEHEQKVSTQSGCHLHLVSLTLGMHASSRRACSVDAGEVWD